MKYSKTVPEYLAAHPQWEPALSILRETMLSLSLQETVKWGGPVYTVQGKNVAGLGAFKEYVAIWFFQGAMLKDEKRRLVNAQEGKTKALRQWRFASREAIEADLENIRLYVKEAIANAEAGLEIKPQRKKTLELPEELSRCFEQNPKIGDSFKKLTPGKQREYAEYIAEAKRAETRRNRLEKIAPMILEGIGLNDKYKR